MQLQIWRAPNVDTSAQRIERHEAILHFILRDSTIPGAHVENGLYSDGLTSTTWREHFSRNRVAF